MEAFSLLKFWRFNPGDDPSSGGIGGIGGGFIADVTNDGHIPAVETDDETDDDEDSFFDLEFTVPGEDSNNGLSKKNGHTASDSVESHNDVFYKGRSSPSESNSKPQSPIAFLRSSPKFRVLMLFKKPKLDKTEATNASSKQLAVKCDVEEFPIWSLLNRVNSTRSKFQKKSTEEDSTKRFTKDVVQKYLKLIRPLYVRVSKRYGDNVKFSDKASAGDPSSSPTTLRSPSNRAEEKQGSRVPPLRVVCKLGKSRSASSSAGNVSLRGSKRDDSLLLEHDGIQSAILHCKSSYNSSRDFSMLSRFARETSCDISDNARKSSDDEKKRSSI